MFRDGRILVGKRLPQGRIGTPVPTEVAATSSNFNVLEVSEDGPTERTNKDRELQEVGFTDAANYGVPQTCSLPRSH
jgi:hypothetical protein